MIAIAGRKALLTGLSCYGKIGPLHEALPIKGNYPALASNEPPLIFCEVCGEPATEVCAQCVYEGAGWLCDACGEEMLLPVVNFPRVGMCGYTGPAVWRDNWLHFQFTFMYTVATVDFMALVRGTGTFP
jgi:hypothetical protein